MSTYVMSDLHGNYEAYKKMLEMRVIFPILQLLTDTYQAEEPPIEDYKELHTTYRRELRRRLNSLLKSMCDQNDRFVSIEMAEDLLVDNALNRWLQKIGVNGGKWMKVFKGGIL